MRISLSTEKRETRPCRRSARRELSISSTIAAIVTFSRATLARISSASCCLSAAMGLGSTLPNSPTEPVNGSPQSRPAWQNHAWRSTGSDPLAPQPQSHRVQRLIHRSTRRHLPLEPLEQRHRSLRTSARRRTPILRRPAAHMHDPGAVRHTDQQQRLGLIAMAAEQQRKLTRRAVAQANARSTTIAANSNAR